MSQRLEQFLRSGELDDAVQLVADLRELTAEEREQINAVIDDGSDPQAVANLLMEPSLLESGQRARTLLRHLRGDPLSYLTLAACVGAAQLHHDDMVEHQDREIAAALLDLTEAHAPDVTAQLASVALVSTAKSAPFESLVALLDHGDATVRHNALAAVVAVVGPRRAADVVRARSQPDGGGDELQALDRASALSPEDQALEGVAIPALSYIPNMADWRT